MWAIALPLLSSAKAIGQEINEVFGSMRGVLSKIAAKLYQDYTVKDLSVEVSYKEINQFESHFKFSGDLLMISMHSNIFNFATGHSILQSEYVKDVFEILVI